MRASACRDLLWLSLILVVPLPIHLAGDALVPVARMLLLAGVCLAMIAVEGAGSVAALLAAGFLVFAGLYASVLWVACHLLTRATAGVRDTARTAATLGFAALALAAAIATEPYITPFGTAARGNLLQVLR